jgi:hypothetical protein
MRIGFGEPILTEEVSGAGWRGDLERLGHRAQQRMCPPYAADLFGLGDFN